MTDSISPIKAHKHSHPAVYLLLVLPFGISGGYVTVTFSYLFTQAGVSVDAISALGSTVMLPQVIKFLWAPLVDATLSLKKWYVLTGIVTALCIGVAGLLPVKESSLPMLTLILTLMNVAVSFLGMTTNGLAAYDIPEEMKGKVSGYSQAGNLGGAGLGGGAALWLALHLNSSWVPGVALAVVCLLCCFGLFLVHEPQSTVKATKALHTMQNMLKDIWATMKSRMGFLAVFLCFLPLGTGAVGNLWAAVAGDWHASANTVVFATGIAGGVITAVGCILGGWLCDRMDRKMAYVVFGLIQIICAVGMALCPRTELMFIVWTTLYSFSLGMAYAGFSAVVFEAMGKGAAATKFTIYASLSNFPISYMTKIDGWAHGHVLVGLGLPASGMLYTEAAFGVAGIILFFMVLALVNRKKKVIPAETHFRNEVVNG